MTILLIDSSIITSGRLVELLQDFKEVDNVFYAKDVRKGCVVFTMSRIDVLILVDHLAKDDLLQLTKLCNTCGCTLVLLTNYTHPSYKSWCMSIGIQHLIDKNFETQELKSVLKRINY